MKEALFFYIIPSHFYALSPSFNEVLNTFLEENFSFCTQKILHCFFIRIKNHFLAALLSMAKKIKTDSVLFFSFFLCFSPYELGKHMTAFFIGLIRQRAIILN